MYKEIYIYRATWTQFGLSFYRDSTNSNKYDVDYLKPAKFH